MKLQQRQRPPRQFILLSMRRTLFHNNVILSLILLISFVIGTTQGQPSKAVKVRYGYFPEARPVRVACARGFLQFTDPKTRTNYEVTCYPQTSGAFVASRLDSAQLDLADMGSTPLAQAFAREIDISVIYITDYKGDSQGIYVKPSFDNYQGIESPFDLVNRTLGVPFGSTMHYQVLYILNLFGISGSVNLLNLSPTQIMEAWDAGTIDAAACWGTAREHVLSGKKADTLLSAGVIGDWGRPTFGVIAARRPFIEEHRDFCEYFAAVFGRLTDSFIDNIGANDPANVGRWLPSSNGTTSFLPSLADSIMKAGESNRNPSNEFITQQRKAMDLYIQQPIQEQISCKYLFGGTLCSKPSLLHQHIRQTSEFLLDQKIIHSLGKLKNMGYDTSCQDPDSFCGSDLLDGSILRDGERRYGDVITSTVFSLDNVFPFSEIGRERGDSNCFSGQVLEVGDNILVISDGANADIGKSYSDNMECNWRIVCIGDGACEIDFQRIKIWSGDYIQVYTDPNRECTATSPSLVLLAQITGFHSNFPPLRANGCFFVEFVTDANPERVYDTNGDSGDGFLATVAKYRGQCSCDNRFPCGLDDKLCQCDGLSWGGDCSLTDHCLGTTYLELSLVDSTRTIGSTKSLQFGRTNHAYDIYPNDLDCHFVIKAMGYEALVMLVVEYDLETTFDALELYSGSFSSSGGTRLYTTLTGRTTASETYYIPTDNEGLVTIRLVTDSRGRHPGFIGTVSTAFAPPSPRTCDFGKSGYRCEVNHCIAQNNFAITASPLYTNRAYQIGRVVSQTMDLDMRSVDSICTWSLVQEQPPVSKKTIRIVFNDPLDLEPHKLNAVGDKLVLQSDTSGSTVIFSESCTSDEECAHDWQTGVCVPTKGSCEVKKAFDLRGFDFITIETDRNDNGKRYKGVDFDAFFVQTCPKGDGQQHCESDEGGQCVHGLCICKSGIPCDCPCDGVKVVSELNAGLLAVIIVPLILLAGLGFWWYRRQKIQGSRAQKAIIAEKEEELEAFRNSVVGMRTATTLYLPKSKPIRQSVTEPGGRGIGDLVPMQPPLNPKVQWCWKETSHLMDNHPLDMILGNPKDCWVKYDAGQNLKLEDCYQIYIKTVSNKNRFISPLNGYNIDLENMTQTKEATGFQREVIRVEQVVKVAQEEAAKLNMDDVVVGDLLPEDIRQEPQMALVKGDVIQISSQRQDGWAFGTKLHHNNEVIARELVQLATAGAATDEANVFTDTGWFPMEHTDIPSGEELALLQKAVGDTGSLEPPSYWDVVGDPSIVQQHKLGRDDKEREAVIKAFMTTMKPPFTNKDVQIIRVKRIQNLAMWQSYVVKRQTICYRESGADATSQAQQNAIERFERHWLWHGTNVEVMDKIMQQGFNRSFCGKNATMYGKGVYFARDAAYSAHPAYSVPDKKKNQYIMACRVTVGEYCPGVKNALTPDVRDPKTQRLYDSTVGLLDRDQMSNPSIYVTYHDAQAYPEYLIEFKLK